MIEFFKEDKGSFKPKLAKICIILCSPFTRAQQVIARKKTDVDWNKIKHALKWLRQNNHLYSKLKISSKDVTKPIVIEKMETAESIDNSVKSIYQMRVVFPDGSNVNNSNGGCESRTDFKELTLERMMTECDRREATLVNRPTRKDQKKTKSQTM